MARAQADINTIKWDTLWRVLNEYGDYVIQQARNYLAGNRNYATGFLGDSMEKIVEIEGNHYALYISLADYWDYVENGRKPGKFPPPNKIKEWIMVKPINPYPAANGKLPTINQLSFLIGRKIANEGTEPHPFFKPAKEDAKAKFELAIDYAIAEDVENWIADLIEKQGIYDDLFKMF